MDELIQILTESGLPFAYDHFAEGESPEPPFVCYLLPGSDNFAADGAVYYYATAPAIVEAINKSPNAAAVWNTVYEELVKPCVQMIHANQNAQAHQLYKSYANKLARQYLAGEA